MADKSDQPVFKPLFTEEQIQKRVSELAREISSTIGGGRLLCLVVLRGGFFFASDLIRQLTGFERVEIDFVRLASYAGMHSSGDVKFRGQLPQVAGSNVLVIEDLLDTGTTLSTLSEALRAGGAGSVRYAVLIDKGGRAGKGIEPDFVAFGKLGKDDYLIGYGMDYEGAYRDQRSISVTKRP